MTRAEIRVEVTGRVTTTNHRKQITGSSRIWVEISSCHVLFTADTIPQTTDTCMVQSQSHLEHWVAFCGVQRWVSLLFVAVRSTPACPVDDLVETSQEASVIEAHTSPTHGIMVWGAIGYDNRTNFVLAEWKLNALQYVARLVNTCCHTLHD